MLTSDSDVEDERAAEIGLSSERERQILVNIA
jgi:hypothetical protein